MRNFRHVRKSSLGSSWSSQDRDPEGDSGHAARAIWSEIVGIASRDLNKARKAAADLKIPKAYGSYEEMLADPEIEAVYNPLPNHLHVPWSIRAAEAGKHVLCEKPISLTVAECRTLMEARDRTGVKIGEAFMVRTHPQWLRVAGDCSVRQDRRPARRDVRRSATSIAIPPMCATSRTGAAAD